MKDQLGNKITDRRAISYIQQAIASRRVHQNSGELKSFSETTSENESSFECTTIEMIGINRPGLFSEISAILAEERCNVVEAHAWSHNTCLACVAYVSDESTLTGINDPNRLATIEDHLSTILRPTTLFDEDYKGVKTSFLRCNGSTSHTERRLHQLMLANHDFDGPSEPTNAHCSPMKTDIDVEASKTIVSVNRCNEKGYSIVNVECQDRPKLMFDIVCTLTDMQYAIYHASIMSHGHCTYQEYYIRHMDGCMLNTTEREGVAKCVDAAIKRRVCEGVRLELCAHNSYGLLPYITRVLREHGLTVARADIVTQGEHMRNVFYIQDVSGKEIDVGILKLMRRELEPLAIQLKKERVSQGLDSGERGGLSFVSLIRSQLERFSLTLI